MYQVQLVWNREFNWSNYGELEDNLDKAKNLAIAMRDSGDGASVKKVQVINTENGKVEYRG
jgi:hypothetical protein